MGDYLDVNGKSPLGEELREVCGLGSKQHSKKSESALLTDRCISSRESQLQLSHTVTRVKVWPFKQT